MNTLVSLSIILGSALYIALPFLRKNPVPRGGISPKTHRLLDLYARRDNLLTAIKDVEFDREMGKISDRDFDEISVSYRREATGLLKDIDSLESGDGSAQRLEEELLALRGKRKNGGMAFCPGCGATIDKQDHFCRKCGYRLQKDSL